MHVRVAELPLERCRLYRRRPDGGAGIVGALSTHIERQSTLEGQVSDSIQQACTRIQTAFETMKVEFCEGILSLYIEPGRVHLTGEVTIYGANIKQRLVDGLRAIEAEAQALSHNKQVINLAFTVKMELINVKL